MLYSIDAVVLCPGCHAKDDLQRTDKRAAENIRKSAYSALGFAVLSWLWNPLFLLTVMAVSSGIYALSSFRPDNHRFYQHVEHSRIVITACALVGMALALLPISLRFFGVILSIN